MTATSLRNRVTKSFFLLVVLCTASMSKTIYVDNDGQADFNTIQSAIDDSNDGDTVLVAPGTYTGEGNRDIDFKGKAITVKSEEGPETCIINCQGSEDNPHRGFHFHSNEDTDSILQGFTTTNGYNTYYSGGAILCETSSPHIKDCIVTGNAAWSGGGIACKFSNVVIDNCKIIGNWAEKERGGGILCALGSPHILDCLIEDNTAFEEGGGIKCDNSNITISRCIIRNNSAEFGGGIDCRGEVIITNCFITGNNAKSRGGGINCHEDITIINCFITGNKTGGSGGGIRCDVEISLLNCTIFGNSASSNSYGGGGIHLNAGRISNSIIYGNITRKTTGIEIAQGPHGAAGCRPESIKITNSVVGSDPNAIDAPYCYSGEWLHVDPIFVNPGYWNANGTPDDPNDDFWVEGDYHLKSEMGRWDPSSESWVQDDVTSPCIDAGDPNSDFSGETWPHGGRINMGAYGGTREASMSTETGGMSLPQVAYIYSHRDEEAEDFDSLLEAYGCSTTLIRLNDVPTMLLDSYDLLIVADDTQYEDALSDPNIVAAIEDSNKPIIGLGDGGYDFFGLLGLSIGSPNGGHGSKNSIEVVDPNSSLYSMPYSIEIPQDRSLQLYTETDHVGLYLWPTIPQSVTVFGKEVDSVNYFPLAAEYNRYLLWGFTESPQKMTAVGKTLFINVVIRTANKVL